MRSPLRISLSMTVLVALSSGCSLELLTSAAVQSELQAQSAQSAMKQLDYAERAADEIEIRQGLQAYRAELGAYPPTLHAMVPRYLAEVPTNPDGSDRYAYDPETGWFGLPHQRPVVPISDTDRANLDLIDLALTNFYNDYNQFPGALSQLAPDYLAFVPKTEAGRDFAYIPRSGIVHVPRANPQPTANQQNQTPRNTVPPGIQDQYNGQINDVMDGLGI